ncbi:MAG: acylphosphatase, partial [Phycisphaerales bacterium]
MSQEGESVVRRRLELRGQVQGVGFRPFVYRLACSFGLGGYVANDSNGAVIEVEGRAADLTGFERA